MKMKTTLAVVLAVVLIVAFGVAAIDGAPQAVSNASMSSSMSDMGTSTSNASSSMSDMGTSTSNASSSMSDMGTSTSNASSSMADMGTSMSGMPGMAQSMLDYFNAFKHIMPCGDASMNIPIMDPFRKSIVSLDINHELLVLNGSIENMVVKGLSDFIIIDLVTNTSDERTSWDIIFDNIQLLGNYNLYINADLAGYKFVVNLNGLMDIHVMDFRITTGTTVGKNAVGGMEVSDVDYYVEVGNIESYILDTQWTVAFNDFFNDYVRKTTLLWIQLNREYIHDVLSAYVTNYRNTNLYNTTMEAHLESMVATSKVWNDIPCAASS